MRQPQGGVTYLGWHSLEKVKYFKRVQFLESLDPQESSDFRLPFDRRSERVSPLLCFTGELFLSETLVNYFQWSALLNRPVDRPAMVANVDLTSVS